MKFPEHTCPRCLGPVPNDAHRGEYPGAISRTDNETEICSECGVLEALEEWSGKETGGLMSQDNWDKWVWVQETIDALIKKVPKY